MKYIVLIIFLLSPITLHSQTEHIVHGSDADIEQLHSLHNEYRVRSGWDTVERSSLIDVLATAYAMVNAEAGYISHDHWTDQYYDRMFEYFYVNTDLRDPGWYEARSYFEVIGASYMSVEQAFETFKMSPRHNRALLLDDIFSVGWGAAYNTELDMIVVVGLFLRGHDGL